MKLRSRLFLGFGAIVLLLAIVGLINAAFIIRLDHNVRDVSAARTGIQKQMANCLIAIAAIQANVSSAILTGSESRTENMKALDDQAREFYAILDGINAILPARRDDLADLLKSFQAYYFFGKRILDAKEPRAFLDDENALPYFNALNASLTSTARDAFTVFSSELDGRLAEAQREAYLSILFSLILAAAAFIAAIYASARTARGLITPINRLIGLVTGIKKGGPGATADIHAPEEFARLAEAFNAMSASLLLREQELRASEETYRGIIENASDGFFRTTLEGRILLINPSLARLFGYGSPADIDFESLITGRDAWANPADREAFLLELANKGRVSGREAEFKRTDGSVFLGSVNARLVQDESGEPLYLEGLIADIAPIRELRRLRAVKEAAEAANKAKNQFLAVMSHELRTPLNAIVGMSEALTECGLPPRPAACARSIKEAGDSLLTIISGVLDLSKIEAGRLELDPAPCSLRELMDSVVHIIRPLCEMSELSFTCRVEPELPDRVLADRGRLRQILLNLLGNAVKFTERGEIRLRVSLISRENDALWLLFEISDTGVGIAGENLERIFEDFTQVDASSTRKYGGAGLGLAISKRLVEMLGGEIWAVSDQGKGSVFSFTLPMTQEAAPPAPREIPGEAAPPAADRPLRILAADDNAQNLRLIGLMLEDQPHRLVFATDGEEAVALAGARSFDMALLDLRMPGLDGFEAAKAIRERERAENRARTVIIAVTAHALPDELARALDCGCDAALTKPFVKKDLLALIAAHAPAGPLA